MQCQICSKRTATIHLTEIIKGQRKEMHLCEQCAVENGVAAQSQISINELLTNLLASQPSDEELFGAIDDTVCPHCGCSLNELQKKGVLGCPEDYTVFESTLEMLIEKAHDGRTRHCGKVPKRLPGDLHKEVLLFRLNQQLETAVSHEAYETAAELRDRIRQIEQSPVDMERQGL